jgi:hypothetical protein
MYMKYFLVGLIVLAAAAANAQRILKGSVSESGTNNKMPNVFIRDSNTKQLTITTTKEISK